MKAIMILSVLVFSFNLLLAQNSGEKFISAIPSVPANACNTDQEAQKRYEEKISALIHEVDSHISVLKQQSKPDEAKAKNQAEQMLKQQGISQEDIDKAKSKKMTQEEKQAMAAKMMQQYANMSMSEVQNMKNMSKEGKQAYMEGYAAEAQATAQANAGKINESTNAKADQAGLVSQRNTLYQNIKAQQQAIIDKYQQVAQNPEGLKMTDKMNSLRARMKQLVGGGGEGGWIEKDKKEYEAANTQLEQLKKDYCQKMTPLYFDALQNHLNNLKSSYNDYQQLDDLTGKIDNALLTVGTIGKGGNIEYYEWMKVYLTQLQDAYKYSPDKN